MTYFTEDPALMLDQREAALVRFLWELDENISEMVHALWLLETNGTSLELTEQLYYLAYRVREGALAAEMKEVSQLARVLENIFEHARRGQVEMTSDLIALLVPSCAALRRMTKSGMSVEEEDGETLESNAIGQSVVSVL